MYGVPCGGIGSGTMGRGTTGEFTRFQICPGMYSYRTVPADAFHVCVKSKSSGEALFQSVLQSETRHRRRSDGRVTGWEYNIKDEHISFRGLYPFAWYEYDVPNLRLKLVCRQTSPFLPGDYEDSALPLCLFEWTAVNYGQGEYTVSIGFTFQSGWGEKAADSVLDPSTEDVVSGDGVLAGRKIRQQFRGMPMTYAIAVAEGEGIEAANLRDFNPSSGLV